MNKIRSNRVMTCMAAVVTMTMSIESYAATQQALNQAEEFLARSYQEDEPGGI